MDMNNYIKLGCLLLVLFAYACGSKEKPVEQIVEAPAINERPSMKIALADGNQVDVKALSHKMVLVLFQPDCDHCQREAKEIHDHLGAFKDYQVYFISSHPMQVINQFSKDYQLDNKPNVHFAFTTVDNVLNNFGPISAPSLYIYSEQGKLVKKFNGETDIQEIIKFL